MDEYIERRALLAAYDAAHKGKPGGARKLIEDAPAADVVSRSVHKQVQAELEETVVHQRKRADRAETFICKMCAECNWEIRDGMLFMQKSCCSLSPFDCGKFKLRGQDGFGGLTMDNREKLVEIIQNSVGGCARNWAETIADGLIAHGVTLREWISVKDRLPEPEKTVLISCRGQSSRWGYVCCGFYVPEGTCREDSGYNWDYECCNEYDETKDDYIVNAGWYEAIHNWDDYNAVGIADTVTHWMPLPEPPKGE